MGKILDLTEEQKKLDDELFFLDETSIDYQEKFEAIMSKQMSNNNSLKNMLSFLSDVLLENKQDAESKRNVARSTQKRAITSENKFKNLHSFIHGVMMDNGINKIEGKYGTLSLRKGIEVAFIPDDYNLSELPEELVNYQPESWTPKKNDIKKFLKEGGELDGIALLRGDETLTLR